VFRRDDFERLRVGAGAPFSEAVDQEARFNLCDLPGGTKSDRGSGSISQTKLGSVKPVNRRSGSEESFG
jgi:hypothetical protein